MLNAKSIAPLSWLPNMAIGAGFLIAGLAPLLLLWQDAFSRPVFVVICTTSGVIGFLIMGRSWARYRGTLVERYSVRKLRLPAGWRKESNVALRRGGDLDLLLIGPEDKRFAVEIKSYRGVQLKRASFGKAEELRYKDGRSFSKDPVRQVLAAAEETNSLPVLWMPEAPSTKTLHMKCGVVVVQGKSGNLIKAINGKNWLW